MTVQVRELGERGHVVVEWERGEDDDREGLERILELMETGEDVKLRCQLSCEPERRVYLVFEGVPRT